MNMIYGDQLLNFQKRWEKSGYVGVSRAKKFSMAFQDSSPEYHVLASSLLSTPRPFFRLRQESSSSRRRCALRQSRRRRDVCAVVHLGGVRSCRNYVQYLTVALLIPNLQLRVDVVIIVVFKMLATVIASPQRKLLPLPPRAYAGY
jgi:hypothetical protein